MELNVSIAAGAGNPASAASVLLPVAVILPVIHATIWDSGSYVSATDLEAFACLRGIKAEFCSPPLCVRFCLPTDLLIWGLEGAQSPDFFQNTFRVELVLQPLQRPIDWLTFANDNFWHVFSSISKMYPVPR